jgi:hypothetical protein
MSKNVRILVLQRGWVVVGEYSEQGDECVLSNASVIRIWGTTQGLGELRGGPLENTILDPCGTVRAHKLAVVMQIECPSWKD